MFFTSIAYDYYKGFVTAFIEINGEPTTIFGKPPVKKVVPLVNTFTVMEIIVYIIATVLLMIKLFTGWTLAMLFFPLWIYFGTIFVLMIGLYVLFVISMFKYAKTIGWIIGFIFVLPVVGINVLLAFGGPLLFSILLPVQQGTDLWQAPHVWDSTLPLALALFGALLKGFVRPTDDDENPYAHDTPGSFATIIYFIWFVCMFFFIVLGTMMVDKTIPLTGIALDVIPNWAIVGLPLWIGQCIVLVFFSIKAIWEWKLTVKKHDPDKTSLFRASIYTVLLLIILIAFVCELMLMLKLERQIRFNAAFCLIPLVLGEILALGLVLVPHFVKKRVDYETNEKEMMTPI